ncbi:MAG TPA: Gfo/Idh/MocA family oxidoreductase [Dongiaceae bacterium]|nr:Gfo/Idh/MocA family oxidoreductase [Dongiaceae bacterium]
MNNLDRRSFLKATLVAGASVSLLPSLGRAARTAGSGAQSRVRGANEDIRFAVVGFNGRGVSHIDGLSKVKGTRLVALCDVDHEVLGRQMKRCQDRGQQVQGYEDIRQLLEHPDLDAISIATPNHWHALAAIWAIQAGKDVYVEKPVSHNVWEGRQLVAVARQCQRMVQTGTQSRSSRAIAEAIQWLREGNLGKIRCARGLCYKPRPSIGKAGGPQPIPPSVNYGLWCGPAPVGPLLRKHLHYDWHWVWPTGNGDVGNQGIHQMDLARWVLGETALSPRILSVGGRLGYEDDGTTPNTQIVLHDYPAAPLIFEVRGLPAGSADKNMDRYHGASIGVVVECEGGWMVIGDDANGARIQDKDGQEIKRFSTNQDHGADHFANFIAAVRSRNHADLKADILEGHLSSALCHTGNISYRLGSTRAPEEIREAVKAQPGMAEALGRMEEHLAANQVDLRKTPATLGALLNMDAKTERFIGNEAANPLLTRDYRHPFVVPEKV